eukprot:3901067-Pleurochrysis_carterae.AAC.1
MPSGRRKGPEKSSRTVLEDKAGLGGPGVAVGVGLPLGASVGAIVALGRPGGWSWPVSRAAVATVILLIGEDGFQGKVFSSKYTSDVSTTRGTLGTYML